MNGRFAIVENAGYDKAIILVFDTPHFITGENTAVIGCFGAETLKAFEIGDSIEAHFDARSVLTFDEEIAARKTNKTTIYIGNYLGNGSLINNSNCAFLFYSDILDGKWKLQEVRRQLVLMRIE